MRSTTKSPENLADLVAESIRRLDAWLERNGWAGYDPYDVKGTRFYRWLMGLPSRAELLPLRVIRKAVAFCEERFPLQTRKLFMVKKQVIPKAMGLFARAYLDLYEATGAEQFKSKALTCLKWLFSHPCPGYSGLCWGLPFDWQTVMLIPAGTPCVTVTGVVGDALWRAWEVLGGRRYLEACDSICQFFINDLRIDKIDGEAICFSYTPLDNFHVHNANLFAAEFLSRVGRETRNARYPELGASAASYTLREQNPDGSLYYWGRVQDCYSPHHIDHYHSGFEIRMLYGMWKLTRDERHKEATSRYYRFYRDNLFSKDCVPKMTPQRLYPIDIHSCAEAILCNATLAEDFQEARDLMARVIAWTIANMQTEDGWFIYRIADRGHRQKKVLIPYIRWGQAWTMRALSEAWRQCKQHADL